MCSEVRLLPEKITRITRITIEAVETRATKLHYREKVKEVVALTGSQYILC